MRLQRDFSGLRVFICLAIFVLSGTAFAQTTNNATIDCTGATPGAFTSIDDAVSNSPDHTTFTIVSNCTGPILGIRNRSNLSFFASTPVTITGSPNIQVFTISNSQNISFSGPITVTGGLTGFVIINSQGIFLSQVTVQNNAAFGISTKNSQVQVFNGSISSNTRTGIVTSGGSLELDGVTVSNNGRLGISSNATQLFFIDGNDLPPVVSNNGLAGIQMSNSSASFTDLQINNNAGNNFGLDAFTNSAVVMQGGSINGNTGPGVICSSTSHCEFSQMQINGNTGGGIQTTFHSELDLDGAVQITGNQGAGVLVDQHSAFASAGGNTISGNTGDGLIVNALSTLDFLAPDTITATANNLALNCNNGSLVTGDISTYKPKKCGLAFQAVPIH